MPIILRVEHKKTGMGPYNNGAGAIVLKSHDRPCQMRPSPWNDGINMPGQAWFYGFSCEESLLNWFSWRVLHELARQEYVIAVYSIPLSQIKVGDRQVAFRRGSRKPTHVIDVREL